MFIPLVGYLYIITQLHTFCMSAENRSAAIVVVDYEIRHDSDRRHVLSSRPRGMSRASSISGN